MSRRLLLLVLVVLALPALALAAATDPTKQINPVDQRKAASIVLLRPDVIVPGWKKVPVTTPDSAADPRLPRVQTPTNPTSILTGEADERTSRAARPRSAWSPTSSRPGATRSPRGRGS